MVSLTVTAVNEYLLKLSESKPMKTLKIKSVNISKVKGTKKIPVESILINESGIVDDAHAGDWHRQLSLLAVESISKFNLSSGSNIRYGEFAENITTEGMELHKASPMDRFVSGDVVLELTQIGKKCHGKGCAIYNESGDCVMPKEGIFCKVVKGGTIRAGDVFEYHPQMK